MSAMSTVAGMTVLRLANVEVESVTPTCVQMALTIAPHVAGSVTLASEYGTSSRTMLSRDSRLMVLP